MSSGNPVVADDDLPQEAPRDRRDFFRS